MNENSVFRFLFELTRDQLEPTKIHEMIMNEEIQNKVRVMALQQMEDGKNEQKPAALSSSLGLISPVSSTRSSQSVFPLDLCARSDNSKSFYENVVFDPRFKSNNKMQAPDFGKMFKDNVDYGSVAKKCFEDLQSQASRSQFINLKVEPKEESPPTSISNSSDSEGAAPENFQIDKINFSTKLSRWVGSSIYTNVPERVMTEYDKLLRDSHSLKIKVIRQLNSEFPVSYDYNPKKSRIRTNYADPQVADDRTRNNIASRRSRQRKKFQSQVIQYSVDYDADENTIAHKQLTWLAGMILNLEQSFAAKNGEEAIDKIKSLRKQCGLV